MIDPGRPARGGGWLVPFLRRYAWLLVAMFVGSVCRFWNLTATSPFLDEGWVFHVGQESPHDILRTVATMDAHPPLFYLATHVLIGALHWPIWDYRYFTSFISVLGIAATWAVARRCCGDVAAAVAALALALNPSIVSWDRMYRMYAVVVAVTAISWWVLLRASDAKNASRYAWWVAYAACAVALPYTHYLGALVVAGQLAYALTRIQTLWPALACGLVAAVAFGPWAWALPIQYPHGGLVASLDAPDFSWYAVLRATATEGLPPRWLLLSHFDAIAGFGIIAILLGGVWVARKTVLPYWLAPAAVQVLASYATHKDFAVPRYLLMYMPAFCIAFGALAAFLLGTRYRLGAIILMAAYATFSIEGMTNLLFVPYYQVSDWYQVNAVLLSREKQFDLVVLDQGYPYWVVHDFTGFRDRQIAAPGIPADIPWVIRWLHGYPTRRVWYVENQAFYPDPKRRIEQDLDATRARLAQWQQNRLYEPDTVRIILYGPTRLAAGKKSVVRTTSP